MKITNISLIYKYEESDNRGPFDFLEVGSSYSLGGE
jgi:hypothetical protein